MDTVVHDLVAASLLGCLAILIRIVLDLVQPKSLNDLNLDTLAKGPQRSGDRRNSELQTTKTELSRLSPWETYADYAGCPPYPASVIQKYSEVCLHSTPCSTGKSVLFQLFCECCVRSAGSDV